MKKLLILFLVLVLALPFIGCGIKEKIENSIGEKIVDGVLGDNVDIDGDTMTIKGEDGEEVTIGSTDWPDTELVKNIPEFKGGKISSAMTSDTYVLIIAEEVKEQDFTDYLNDIKNDFTEDKVEINSDGIISYSASNGKGIGVSVSRETENETVTISITKSEE